MDIQYFGANCVTITTKKARVVIDDNLTELGRKSVLRDGDIVLFTGVHADAPKARLVIGQPGEYEVAGISVYGYAARAHMDEEKTKHATMYKVIVDDTRILVTGHVYPELTERQLEEIGTVDLMIVPTGGNGYTTDPIGALKLIKKVDPKMIIPTHYADSEIAYPVPQQDLDAVINGLSMEPSETVEKLKLKGSEFSEGATRLVVLNRS